MKLKERTELGILAIIFEDWVFQQLFCLKWAFLSITPKDNLC